jgi:hypothetical protein
MLGLVSEDVTLVKARHITAALVMSTARLRKKPRSYIDPETL